MKKEFFTRFVLENGKMKKVKVSKEEAMKDIERILEKDKDFLEIMSKM